MKKSIAGGSGGAAGFEAVLPHPGTSRPSGLTRFLESELARAQKRVEELVESAGGPATKTWTGDGDEEEDDDVL